MLDRPSPYSPNALQAAPGGALRPDLAPYDYGYGRYQEVDERDSFNPLQIFFYVLQYRWLIVSLLAIGLVLGFAITMMQTPKYEAAVRLEVMTPSARVFQEMEMVAEASDVRAFLTARERLKSRAIAQRVVLGLGLSEQAAFLFPAPDFAPTNIVRRAFGMRFSEDMADYAPEQREGIAIKRVMDNLSVDLLANTSLLTISFRDQNPVTAQEVANRVAQSYIDSRVDQTGETSELARQFIQDQVLQVKDRLQKSEEALVAYAKEAGITMTGTDSSLIETSIQAINAAQSKAVEERLNYQRLVQQIDQGRGGSLEQVLSSEGLQKLRSEIAGLSAEYQQKLSTFKPGFPEMQQLQAQISELRRQYEGGVAVVTDGVRLKLQEAQSREADLQQKQTELQAEQVAYQDKNIQYTILKREVDSNRSQYDSLIGKLNDVGVATELRQQNASIVDLAPMPQSPVWPRLPINLALALALSAALAAAVVYVLELLNNTFVNPEQLEKELALPVMGILPQVKPAELAASATDPTSGLSEAYRSLRTAIQFAGADGAPKILMVTSAEPAEGKSTTVYKLARDFGVLGSKVVVVDADLRKPAVHRQFGLDNTVGLSNVLTNTVSKEKLPQVIRRTSAENVWTITSGTIPPNPADLLSSQRMALLIGHLAERFDFVIIDSPPVIGLSDAPILGRLARGTLLVVSSNQVTRKAASLALKRLRASGAHVIGAAMSKFSVGKYDYKYAYSYMNNQYYSYGGDAEQLEGPHDQQSGASGSDVHASSGGGLRRRLRAAVARLSGRSRQTVTG
ncbi:GumC family protein [Tianweitania populi]|uniref:non-specific protein-tyrosine kinase n=1 Tax=Tianweitania populi TaxID=1607949 RepID=A0A8J3DKP6_9HYPH|nr:polysaccharide biosynthesis tyrosine autokinase [Tianweitania populi]GHD05580.1 chain-length determining protein [Tianweitania populi]